MQIVYEDNHIIIVNKQPGEIVQGDKTGDTPLSDLVKQYIKESCAKPGAVFLGVVHRIDRPVGGLVIFARTSKALSRLNDMLRRGEIHKTYWAIASGHPEPPEATLTHYITSDGRINKSFASPQPTGREGEKKSVLEYSTLAHGDNFSLLQINLLTGRKHQIRAQLAAIGSPIRGDLKYGARRSNPDGSISLLARRISFIHPVSKKLIEVEAPLPADSLWQTLASNIPSEV